MTPERRSLLADADTALVRLRDQFITDQEFNREVVKVRAVLHELAEMDDGADLRATLRDVLALVDTRGYMTAEQQEVLRRAREVAR